MKATSSAICLLVLECLLSASSSWAWVSLPRHRISPPSMILLQGSEGDSDMEYSGESDEVRLARAQLMDSYSKVWELSNIAYYASVSNHFIRLYWTRSVLMRIPIDELLDLSIGWLIFSQSVRRRKRVFLNYVDACLWARRQGFSSQEEWEDWVNLVRALMHTSRHIKTSTHIKL